MGLVLCVMSKRHTLGKISGVPFNNRFKINPLVCTLHFELIKKQYVSRHTTKFGTNFYTVFFPILYYIIIVLITLEKDLSPKAEELNNYNFHLVEVPAVLHDGEECCLQFVPLMP